MQVIHAPPFARQALGFSLYISWLNDPTNTNTVVDCPYFCQFCNCSVVIGSWNMEVSQMGDSIIGIPAYRIISK
jgi:hypothetical protein